MNPPNGIPLRVPDSPLSFFRMLMQVHNSIANPHPQSRTPPHASSSSHSSSHPHPPYSQTENRHESQDGHDGQDFDSMSSASGYDPLFLSMLTAEDTEKAIKDPFYPFVLSDSLLHIAWTSQGCGSFLFYDRKWSFCIPVPPHPQYVPVSHICRSDVPNDESTSAALFIVDDPRFCVPVYEYELVWCDKGSGAKSDCAVWRGIPPNENFVMLGDAVTSGYQPPSLERGNVLYAVHKALVNAMPLRQLGYIVDDEDSHADMDASFWRTQHGTMWASKTYRPDGIRALLWSPRPVASHLLVRSNGLLERVVELQAELDLLRQKQTPPH